ncbi:hypothetical protein DACRYDRAFT_18873 [Dacryopinax primogenitus]|uniref:Uncharacterized protein n=1 Tax=Dacryopinax primogenitus (strain DJM 731) TaxID=1858805 RepID=M5FNB3_DACPD|nr:uncharacterized protein DACRYDRAFT_18873 [Dacryopinax primogenitus]EJT97145.1 hypothetical protein DACRYDRAFT_18873 [Dacryopinax primogenitus]
MFSTVFHVIPRNVGHTRLFSLMLHALRYSSKNEKPGITRQGDAQAAGKEAAEKGSPVGLDSATHSRGGMSSGEEHKKDPSAGIGMKDQVGGSSIKGKSHVGPKEKWIMTGGKGEYIMQQDSTSRLYATLSIVSLPPI